MSDQEKELESLLKKYYAYCYKKSGDHELSEDISLRAIELYLSEKDRIKNKSAWLKKTTGNLLKKYYRDKVKDKKINDSLSRKIQSGKDDEKRLKVQDLHKYLSPEESELLMKYYNHEISRDKLASENNLSLNALRLQVAKLNKMIQVKDKLEEGYRMGRDLLLPEVKSKFSYFKKALEKAISSGDFSKMKRYFGDIPPEKIALLRDIKKIEADGFRIKGDSEYRMYLVYFNKKDKLANIDIDFCIADNHLKAVGLGKKASAVVQITDEKDKEFLTEVMNKPGLKVSSDYDIPHDILKKMIKKYKERTELKK